MKKKGGVCVCVCVRVCVCVCGGGGGRGPNCCHRCDARRGQINVFVSAHRWEEKETTL